MHLELLFSFENLKKTREINFYVIKRNQAEIQ